MGAREVRGRADVVSSWRTWKKEDFLRCRECDLLHPNVTEKMKVEAAQDRWRDHVRAYPEQMVAWDRDVDQDKVGAHVPRLYEFTNDQIAVCVGPPHVEMIGEMIRYEWAGERWVADGVTTVAP